MTGDEELHLLMDGLAESQGQIDRLAVLEDLEELEHWKMKRDECIRRIRDLMGDSCPICKQRGDHDIDCLLRP
jgi:hypothetical protein